MSNQDNVLNYIRNRNKSSLIFCDSYSPIKDKKDIADFKDLDDAIIKCLHLTFLYDSYREDENIFETSRSKWRSSLDIWRHVKHYLPDTNIFEVMESLFRQRKQLSGHYCPNIHRRVFKLSKDYNNHGLMIYNYDGSLVTDEYGLNFYDWENINGN